MTKILSVDVKVDPEYIIRSMKLISIKGKTAKHTSVFVQQKENEDDIITVTTSPLPDVELAQAISEAETFARELETFDNVTQIEITKNTEIYLQWIKTRLDKLTEAAKRVPMEMRNARQNFFFDHIAEIMADVPWAGIDEFNEYKKNKLTEIQATQI